jgi:hypothetical protein
MSVSVRPVTFTSVETAAIAGVGERKLENMITFKQFKPFIVGTRGKGNGHRFSGQQLYAIAVIGALRRAGKLPSSEYVKEVFDMFEAMSDAALAEFSGGEARGAEVDDVTEEAITDYFSKREVTGMFDEDRTPLTPSDIRCRNDMQERFARVDEAIAIRRKQPWVESRRVSSAVSNRKVSDILR